MSRWHRLTSLVVTLSLAGAVLAPFPAAAGSQEDPDLYQDSLKTDRPEDGGTHLGHMAGAAVFSAVSMPFRIGTCAIGIGAMFATLAITFGSGHGAASSVFKEACIDHYIVTDEDVREANRDGIRRDPWVE
jgi:hypothetical protein